MRLSTKTLNILFISLLILSLILFYYFIFLKIQDNKSVTSNTELTESIKIKSNFKEEMTQLKINGNMDINNPFVIYFDPYENLCFVDIRMNELIFKIKIINEKDKIEYKLILYKLNYHDQTPLYVYLGTIQQSTDIKEIQDIYNLLILKMNNRNRIVKINTD